jgi:putative ABC transport system permease protein
MIGSDIAEFTRLEPGGLTTLTGRGEDGARFSREVKISGIARTGGVEDGFIFMGIEPFGALMGGEGTADTAEVSVAADGAKLDEIASNIAKKIPEISPRLVRRVTQSETAVLSKLQSLVFLVSSVVLALTMICVATTMMTVAMERRREIGLKKAIGADRRSIEAEFLAEGMLLGCAGGALGSALGYAFAQAVSLNVFGRGVAASWWLWPVTVFVSAAVTVAACLAPAKSAAAVEPAIVLRGE